MTTSEKEIFEKNGRVEIPVRGIHSQQFVWLIVDVQTGGIVDKIQAEGVLVPKFGLSKSILLVLDGDHILIEDCYVFSLPKKRGVQDLKKMRELVGDDQFFSSFATLPATEKYAFSISREDSVFDPNRIVKTVIVSRGQKMQVWSWSDGTMKYEYTFTFKASIEHVMALPGASQVLSGNEIGIQFRDAFVIFDVKQRKKLRRIEGYSSTEDERGSFFLLPPSGNLGLARRGKKGYSFIEDVTSLLEKGIQGYRKIDYAEPVNLIAEFEEEPDFWLITEKDGRYFFLLWYPGKEWKRGSSNTPASMRNVKVEGKEVKSAPVGQVR